MNIQILHNPRCSKSRQTLQLLRDQGHNPEITEYLKQPLSKEDILDILHKLGISANEIIRKQETAYKDAGLSSASTEADLIDAMTRFPVLIERPIVIRGDKAAIGRPPESVLDIL